MTWSAMTQSALCTVCTGCEHRPSIQRSEERWETLCTDTQDLYLKLRGEMGDSGPGTQHLCLQVRGEVGPQCTDTQDSYLKVRGQVGDSGTGIQK